MAIFDLDNSFVEIRGSSNLENTNLEINLLPKHMQNIYWPFFLYGIFDADIFSLADNIDSQKKVLKLA